MPEDLLATDIAPVETMTDKTYWAAEPDPEKLVRNSLDRIRAYQEAWQNSRFLSRMARSYRYYHGLFFGGSFSLTDNAIIYLGDNGEYAGLSVNDFRSLIDQVVAMITRNVPNYTVEARNSDLAALTQSRIGKDLLNAYITDRKLEKYLSRAVLHAMIFNVGYITTTWDPFMGEEAGEADPETGEIFRTGDVAYANPTVFDVAFDPTAQTWEDEVQWVAVRKRINRFDLAARFPEEYDRLINYSADDDESWILFSRNFYDEENTDLIDEWVVYHLPCETLPEGRMWSHVGDIYLPGSDVPLPYKGLPIDRLASGETILTCFGYSPALDMQGPQEAYNAELSAIATNHKAFGVQNVWVQEGDIPTYAQFPGGLNVLQSRQKPEPLNLLETKSEVFQFAQILQRSNEATSGINSVRRGQPEGGLKGASGSAFALLDAKALESNHELQKNYRQVFEGVGTKTLRLLNTFPDHPRTMALTGKHRRAYQVQIQRDFLDSIERVRVEAANPMLSTMSGKWEIAQVLMQNNRVTNQEFLTFVQTGELDPMLEAANAQLSIVREENEAMLDGRIDIQALAIDDHVLHIREHSALLNTMEMRTNQQLTSIVSAHIQTHIQMLVNPGVMMMQQALGYDLPLPPMTTGAPPQEKPPGEPGPGPQPSSGQTLGEAAPMPSEPRMPQNPSEA